ncbi:hypothetical protein C8Q80DRAFT_1124323 [Daedaleopsis nitida]|nr:hypothetical protein C8Q80DRAFT_1124323 [Daedaleopsis nitida]
MSPRHPKGAHEESQVMKTIDLANISQTVEFLQELRRHINALPCINQLPVELLVEIFKYVTHSSYDILHDGSVFRKVDHSPLLNLITITHVCHRWRDIAVDASMLWGRIPILANESLLKLFVERSRNTSLTLNVVVKNKGRKLVDNILSGASVRLQTLHIFDARSPFARHPPLYQRPLHLELPKLLCCMIISKADRRGFGWSNSASSGSMPTIFSKPTSTLRALAVVPVAWLPGNHFPCLSHLHLSFSTDNGNALVSHLGRLLSLLDHTPRLAFLQLRDVGQARDSFGTANLTFTQPSERKPVTLSRLRSLIVIESGMRMIFSFLDYLDLPETVVMRFSGTDMNYASTANSRAIRIPPFPSLNALSRVELAAVKRSLHLAAAPAEACGTAPVHPLTAGFWLQAKTYPEHENKDWTPWLLSLHTTFPLSSLSTLHICVQDPELLLSILPRAPRLTELGVLLPDHRGDVWQPCVKSLCAVLGRSDTVYCPRLRVLALETHVRPENMSCYSRIVDMAAVRAQCGRRLRRVALRAVFGWRPWDPSVSELFGPVFARLDAHVDEVLYSGAGDPPLVTFNMHERWVEAEVEAERYWEVEKCSEGRYMLPWESPKC